MAGASLHNTGQLDVTGAGKRLQYSAQATDEDKTFTGIAPPNRPARLGGPPKLPIQWVTETFPTGAKGPNVKPMPN
jgi:hypothetical protein